MNYQGSTCICRVPKAQVRAGTVVECVHCGKLIPSLSYPIINIIAKGVGVAVPILNVFSKIPVELRCWLSCYREDRGIGQAKVPMTYPSLLFMYLHSPSLLHPAQAHNCTFLWYSVLIKIIQAGDSNLEVLQSIILCTQPDICIYAKLLGTYIQPIHFDGIIHQMVSSHHVSLSRSCLIMRCLPSPEHRTVVGCGGLHGITIFFLCLFDQNCHVFAAPSLRSRTCLAFPAWKE